jgi:hypothetical protein
LAGATADALCTNRGWGVDEEKRVSQDAGRTFMSYSRKDSAVVARLTTALREKGLAVFRDTDDILPAEEWKGRLEQLIGLSDAVIFALSPHSLSSDVCAWEVQAAQSLHKRVIPVVVGAVNDRAVPPGLARLNYVFADTQENLDQAVQQVVYAIQLDIDWVREHTRIGEVASRWEARGRSVEGLASGQELAGLLDWMQRQPPSAPPPTPRQLEYIVASQRYASELDEYEQARYAALEGYVGPILHQKIESLSKEVEQEEGHQRESNILRVSAAAGKIKAEIDTIANFLAQEGKWHPQKAEYHKAGGATEDYADIYRFPCCGMYVITDNREPSRFRADGCQSKP